MKNILMTIIVAAYIQTAWGQGILKHDSKQVGNNNITSNVNLRLQYTSDWVYAGRKDSLPAAYLTPSILYTHESGFYVKGFLSFLTSEKRIDLWGVGAGYKMNKGNFYWGIGGELRIFNDSSYAIQSSVNAMAFTYLGYDLPWIETTVDLNGFLGETGDILVGLELGKTFLLSDNKFSIYPNVYGLMGTQRYYSKYYSYKRTTQSKKLGQEGNILPRVNNYSIMEEAKKIKFLSIDLGIAFKYSLNNVSFYFIPSFAIPFNAATFKTVNSISKENLKNTFYYTLGINFLL
jgi:hypothetical protein